MAKSDLLKEAIADANAVRETALANAKIALEEAFTPRIQSMIGEKLADELNDGMYEQEEEEEMDMDMGDEEASMDDMEAGEAGGLDVTIDDPSTEVSPDYQGTVAAAEPAGEEAEMDMDAEEAPMDDMDDDMEDDDLELEAIIRELEEDMDKEDMDEAEDMEEGMYGKKEEMEEDIDSIIEAILSEEEMEEQVADEAGDDGNGMLPEATELEEAYDTIDQLREVLQEVNLLNAKLLYTNKLFRNFELSENQKMKVIENFDRAGNTREVKLVFSTLAESFQKPAKKRVVKEHKNVASKAVGTTAPAKEIISESNEVADRFKKLAGLL